MSRNFFLISAWCIGGSVSGASNAGDAKYKAMMPGLEHVIPSIASNIPIIVHAYPGRGERSLPRCLWDRCWPNSAFPALATSKHSDSIQSLKNLIFCQWKDLKTVAPIPSLGLSATLDRFHKCHSDECSVMIFWDWNGTDSGHSLTDRFDCYSSRKRIRKVKKDCIKFPV